ncbi:hypothetical protein BGW80DRAFT_275209 [Lactifluus volemus]|nr:hypothetical protein BGW80DRAFT_275209 [Lactifluus volemus]
MPTDIPFTKLDPYTARPQFPAQGGSASLESRAGTSFFAPPSVPAQNLSYPTYSLNDFQESYRRRSHSQPVPEIGFLAETVDERLDTTYGHHLHSSHSGAGPAHNTHDVEHSAHRMRRQSTCESRFTCEFCGKEFSGKWEMGRHVKSIHNPPTFGCRRCQYKQSRKDLFREHCKKRHPGEPIEGLMHSLSTEDS